MYTRSVDFSLLYLTSSFVSCCGTYHNGATETLGSLRQYTALLHLLISSQFPCHRKWSRATRSPQAPGDTAHRTTHIRVLFQKVFSLQRIAVSSRSSLSVYFLISASNSFIFVFLSSIFSLLLAIFAFLFGLLRHDSLKLTPQSLHGSKLVADLYDTTVSAFEDLGDEHADRDRPATIALTAITPSRLRLSLLMFCSTCSRD